MNRDSKVKNKSMKQQKKSYIKLRSFNLCIPFLIEAIATIIQYKYSNTLLVSWNKL